MLLISCRAFRIACFRGDSAPWDDAPACRVLLSLGLLFMKLGSFKFTEDFLFSRLRALYEGIRAYEEHDGVKQVRGHFHELWIHAPQDFREPFRHGLAFVGMELPGRLKRNGFRQFGKAPKPCADKLGEIVSGKGLAGRRFLLRGFSVGREQLCV